MILKLSIARCQLGQFGNPNPPMGDLLQQNLFPPNVQRPAPAQQFQSTAGQEATLPLPSLPLNIPSMSTQTPSIQTGKTQPQIPQSSMQGAPNQRSQNILDLGLGAVNSFVDGVGGMAETGVHACVDWSKEVVGILSSLLLIQ